MPSIWPARGDIRTERATGPFAGPTPLVLMCAFLVVVASAPGVPRRPGWLTPIGLCAALGVVAISFLRAAWLGAVIAIVVVLVARGGRRLALRVGAALACAGVVLMVGLAASPHARERVTSTRQVESRIITGAAGLRMVADRPLLGFGWFAYDAHDSDYVEPVWGIEPREFDRQTSSHNGFLTVAAELGLPGLGLALVAPAVAVVSGLRNRCRREAVALLGFLGLMVTIMMTTDVRFRVLDLALGAVVLGLLANLRDPPLLVIEDQAG